MKSGPEEGRHDGAAPDRSAAAAPGCSRSEGNELIIHWDICYEYHHDSSSLAEHFDYDVLLVNPEETHAISYWLAPGSQEEAQHALPPGFLPHLRVDLDPDIGAGAARWFPGRVYEMAAEEEGYQPQGFRSWGSGSTMTIVPGSIARVSYATARRLALEYADTGRQPIGVRWVG